MGDLLRQGSRWLGAMLKEHASSPVTYSRGETEAELQATFGKTEYEVEDENGFRVGASVIDFLILGEDLAATFEQPKRGDRITTDGMVYEVMALAGAGHWRFNDPHRMTMRIHTKHVETI